jgi:uncharacterized membrane protein
MHHSSGDDTAIYRLSTREAWENKVRKIMLAVWLAMCATVLASALYLNAGDPTAREIGPVFIWYMIFLSFPGGLLVAATGALISALSAGEMNLSVTVSFLVIWVAFVAVGYAQWFVLVPYLKRKLDGGISTS